MSPIIQTKIYHIIHLDRLSSIVNDGFLWCDREAVKRVSIGTSIGMDKIKLRRLNELTLKNNYPELFVGDCVPFYFCPRSVMLYLIYRANHDELQYQGGQDSILHLQADLYKTIEWAKQFSRKWVFTTSSAASKYFDDYSNMAELSLIEWDAVNARDWTECREKKQAEFLIEYSFPWHLITYIGVKNEVDFKKVASILQYNPHQPRIEIKPQWYY